MPCLPWLLNVPPDIHVSEKPCLSLSEPRTYLEYVCASVFGMVLTYTRLCSSATTVQIKRSWGLACLKLSKRVFIISENHIINGCTIYGIWTAHTYQYQSAFIGITPSDSIICASIWLPRYVSLCSQGWAVVHSDNYYIIVSFIIMVVRFSKYKYRQTS